MLRSRCIEVPAPQVAIVAWPLGGRPCPRRGSEMAMGNR